MSNDYYILKGSEERYYIFDIAFLEPVFIAIAFFVLRSLMSHHVKQQNEINPFKSKSLKLGVSCIILFTTGRIYNVFICNDLLFNIDIQNPKISIANDAIIAILYFVGKSVLYYSMTYYHQSILYEYDNNHKMSKLVLVWVILSAIVWTVIGTVFVVDDAMEESSKEIAFTKKRNIHLSNIMGHDGAPLGALSFAIVIIFDFAYFAVLIGLFVSALRKMKSNANINVNEFAKISEQSLKALVLIVFTCITLWINCFNIALNLDIRWVFGTIDTGSDIICVYFLFVESNLYWVFFGVFHDCLGKCLYGSGYKRISNKLGYNRIEMDDMDNEEAVQDAI